MTILGIDPGTATTGFGIIQQQTTSQWAAVDYGIITTDKALPDEERLLVLAEDLELLIRKHKPTIAGVEKLYFETNVKTAMTVAQARGAILLTLARHKIPLYEFTPLQVKNILTGYGAADKKQMQFMIKQVFKLKSAPKPDDAADALAIALCAGFARKNKSQ